MTLALERTLNSLEIQLWDQLQLSSSLPLVGEIKQQCKGSESERDVGTLYQVSEHEAWTSIGWVCSKISKAHTLALSLDLRLFLYTGFSICTLSFFSVSASHGWAGIWDNTIFFSLQFQIADLSNVSTWELTVLVVKLHLFNERKQVMASLCCLTCQRHHPNRTKYLNMAL